MERENKQLKSFSETSWQAFSKTQEVTQNIQQKQYQS